MTDIIVFRDFPYMKEKNIFEIIYRKVFRNAIYGQLELLKSQKVHMTPFGSLHAPNTHSLHSFYIYLKTSEKIMDDP